MDWFGGRVSLGNLDLSGAVNKLSESVKNIEKNFDSALGFEEKSESSSSQGPSADATNRKALFGPSLDFMAQKGEEAAVESKVEGSIADPKATTESLEELSSSRQDSPSAEKGINADSSPNSETKEIVPPEEESHMLKDRMDHAIPDTSEETAVATEGSETMNSDSNLRPGRVPEYVIEDVDTTKSAEQLDEKNNLDESSLEKSEAIESKEEMDEAEQPSYGDKINGGSNDSDVQENREEKSDQPLDGGSSVLAEASIDRQLEVLAEPSRASFDIAEQSQSPGKSASSVLPTEISVDGAAEMPPEQSPKEPDSAVGAVDVKEAADDAEVDTREPRLSAASTASEHVDFVVELEKVKREMKMMEAALQGAARQAQAKADEIARLMSENEHLKSAVEDLTRRPNEAEIESLREEYHQRVATLERKVYALTKERDTLRREQSKKSDAAALLKEKDEIINQIMAEGEELSKKQATQEATIRKLRAQVRELEEEKKGLNTKLQVEESKVESIKKDKAATEKLLQETIERHQAELTAQKAYYTDALNAAKEAEALAEARANTEARTELESRLREAEEREGMLVQALEELRQTLSRQEQQAAFREDMLRRDMEDLQRRYQASERRCEELVTQVPDSTRPLLRQIEAMQETYARRDEAWAAVERNLNSRLQEAEARSAAAEERERSVNERLSQTLSRINVLEAQISCLRTEQTQLARSLEKERQRAAENRQEYLAAKEEADTHEGRVNQLEEELRELKRKHKQELQESLAHRELLQQEVEREKTARLELEKINCAQPPLPDHNTSTKSSLENGRLMRKLSSASSVGNIEESFFLQASLESSDNVLERRNSGEVSMSPYHLKSMTPSAFEATLRQKEGELSSYMSRLASLESIRDSLAEELVKMTEQCDKLRTEAATFPGIRAELEALRRRHTAALELMGERDEELEELRADIVDLKEMYREQVNLLVNKIQILSSQMGNG